MVTPRQYEVHLVNLDPTVGSEIQKTRPCLIVSPDELNQWIATVIVAPMTTGSRSFPTRVPVEFEGRVGQIVLDRLRTVDKTRLVRPLGRISESTQQAVLTALAELFAP